MNLEDIRHCRVLPIERRLQIGDLIYNFDESLHLDAPFEGLSIRPLVDLVKPYLALSNGECQPQAAILIFELTGKIQALAHFFPILHLLNPKQQIEFHSLLQSLVANQNLRVVMKGMADKRIRQSVPHGIRILIAGHILEVFFFRQEMLTRLFNHRRSFWIYPTKQAFSEAGGRGGGDYHPVLRCIRLTMQRIVEGFYGKTPAQAPFLHEFGHMLEHFESCKGLRMWGTGLLPGMLEQDGSLFNPEARTLFIEGKHLELLRYQKLQQQNPGEAAVQPVGSPYVFQNNSEFIAGYLEMFFRNPHYFATQNITLYWAFERTFGWDPRQVWEQDFDAYVRSNQLAYSSGKTLNASGLS